MELSKRGKLVCFTMLQLSVLQTLRTLSNIYYNSTQNGVFHKYPIEISVVTQLDKRFIIIRECS